ncbi:MAG: hypothetical protein K2M40_07010 [Muribaculaceae bacterium]|nr:hypothetical protein [Bacteroidales bacterium]MBD5326606.1 hypothetical protein [Bacteroides sp.]MDE6222416.1 hypothetical protein [Muribaculaceae bacterium]MBD5415063.1 hypothetical protein [Bacteroides sp.]MBD5424931.1 hypothetical protein [Bacteroides sp.]
MKKLSPVLFLVGLLLVAAGVLMPILSNDPFNNEFRYVYAVGAALSLLSRLFQQAPDKSAPIKIRRLLRMESWSSLLFCVAAFFAFYSAPELRDWLAFTLAGAAIQIYCTIALSIALRKKL